MIFQQKRVPAFTLRRFSWYGIYDPKKKRIDMLQHVMIIAFFRRA